MDSISVFLHDDVFKIYSLIKNGLNSPSGKRVKTVMTVFFTQVFALAYRMWYAYMYISINIFVDLSTICF
jgi:hypothetical protein